MTDNGIIKALECMLGKYSIGEQMNCTGCAFETQGLCSENASDGIVKAALYLINRLKADNKMLKAKVARLQKYDEERDIALHARLTEKARIEAVKEFAERVKNYIDVGHLRPPTEICFSDLAVVKMIDKLTKEMVGADNGQQ